MTFPLMQMPMELRLIVFKMALSIDQDNEMFIWNHKNVKKPPLLQTCREIRQIGTPLFYRNNSFVIETVDLTSRTFLRAPEGNWLEEIGGEDIANLRFVTFGDTVQGEYYRIKIDLASNDPSGWTVCPDAKHHRTTCDASRTFTLTEKTIADLSSKDAWKAQILRDCISIARKGMSKLHDECGYGTSMRPTVDALDDLHTPFLDVTDKCMKLGL